MYVSFYLCRCLSVYMCVNFSRFLSGSRCHNWCIYVCLCLYKYVCLFHCISMCAHNCECLCVCICLCIYMRFSFFVFYKREGVYFCTQECIDIYICMWQNSQVCTCMHPLLSVILFMQIWFSECIYMCVCLYMYLFICGYAVVCMFWYV